MVVMSNFRDGPVPLAGTAVPSLTQRHSEGGYGDRYLTYLVTSALEMFVG